MKLERKKIFFAVVTAALLGSQAIGQVVQLQLTSDVNIRASSEFLEEFEYLAPVQTLPAGAVVEIQKRNLESPEFIPYGNPNASELRNSRYGFVEDVKVISAPGMSAEEVTALNNSAQTLFAAKGILRRARLIKTIHDQMQFQTNVPLPVFKSVVDIDPASMSELATRLGDINSDVEEALNPAPCTDCDIRNTPETKDNRPPKVNEPDQIAEGSTSLTGNAAILKELSRRVPSLSAKAVDNTIKFLQTRGGKITNNDFITIIDYTQPSTAKRMYIFNMKDRTVRNEFVAHGMNSGGNYARLFSNRNKSHQSSLGFYKTGEMKTTGKHVPSMYLYGLDSTNSIAAARDIIMHGADYVSPGFIRRHGRLGRSHGCPAVEKRLIKPLIRDLRGGSLMYAFGG